MINRRSTFLGKRCPPVPAHAPPTPAHRSLPAPPLPASTSGIGRRDFLASKWNVFSYGCEFLLLQRESSTLLCLDTLSFARIWFDFGPRPELVRMGTRETREVQRIPQHRVSQPQLRNQVPGKL